MNKKSYRVIWLLLIMIVILGISFGIDGIRQNKHKTENVAVVNSDTGNNEVGTTETTEETTEENTEETTEGTTLSPEEASQKISDFYNGQVFMGDSIMAGFSIFASTKAAPEWLNNVIFLAQTSWSINGALSGTGGPMYQGKSQNVCLTLSEIMPKRVFINLGINEMNGLGTPGYSIEKLVGKYADFITNVKTAVPECDIYVISVTPCTAEKETPTFSNSIIKEFDEALEAKMNEMGVKYLDLASEFGDALDPEYAKDNYVHHNDKSYLEKWVPFFEKLALSE